MSIGQSASQAEGLYAARLQIAKSYQQAALLIPQRQPPTSHAFAERYPFRDAVQLRSEVETSLQAVIRNSAAQVMNMVQADIAAEPLQDGRQLEIGAAAERRGVEVPVSFLVPICVFELVLDVEQPISDPRSDDHHRQIGRKDGDNADQSHRETEGDGQSNVQRQDAAPC